MGTFLATWEDEENNRNIQFSVQYATENSEVSLLKITPTKVSFVCPETNTCIRSIGVHTESGRDLLVHRFSTTDRIAQLKTAIASRQDSMISA